MSAARNIAIAEAARVVLATWRAAPHAIIRLDLKRAIEALAAAVEGHEAAMALDAAMNQRTLDHEAWARHLQGSDHG